MILSVNGPGTGFYPDRLVILMALRTGQAVESHTEFSISNSEFASSISNVLSNIGSSNIVFQVKLNKSFQYFFLFSLWHPDNKFTLCCK